mmetsp:Transcript_21131/g.42114  ORF Transcript_21131/g.42114 Transcript_21131/m.42114 type:complete len:185 (-) Transcript_21131:108-662(-)
MKRKFGSMENFVQFRQRHDLPGRGAEVKLDELGFVQENLSKRVQSSTVKSHRLVQYITLRHGVDVAEAFYERLNVEHFVRSGVLNDRELLLRLAGEVGIGGVDLASLTEFLDSNRGTDAVLRAVDVVHSYGIHSIPTLIIGGEAMLSGASRTEEVQAALLEFVKSGRGGETKRLFSDVLDSIEV